MGRSKEGKRIYILSGGLTVPIAPHFSVCAPAFGQVGRFIDDILRIKGIPGVRLIESAMAGNHGDEYVDTFIANGHPRPVSSKMKTNADFAALLDVLIQNPRTKILFLPITVCDWEPTTIWDHSTGSYELAEGEKGRRLSAREMEVEKISPGRELMSVRFRPAEKFLKRIRANRKDIFVVSFSHTAGASREEQYSKALRMLKEGSVNLVLANDVKSRNNMIVAPEETVYHESTAEKISRREVIVRLVDMALQRSSNTFTRSTVVEDSLIPWNSELIPAALRDTVNFCIDNQAYKPFLGVTAGHFAVKLGDNRILTSVRKSNFNSLKDNGLVLVEYQGLDKVVAHGAKPSVGGQSQRIIFDSHPEMDSIVHFHCPPREGMHPPQASQEYNECGSHQCGLNTSNHLKDVPGIPGMKYVYLDNHGPNIVFDSKRVKADQVIHFIQATFDLSAKTGGIIPDDGENRRKDS